MFRLGLGINLNTPSSRGTQTLFYNPIALFSNGEEGAWYEPSTTTAFRSTTDLTPCEFGTGVIADQQCGFLLDKSKGAGYSGGSFTGLGSELITNGDFATNDLTGWTDASSGGTVTVSNEEVTLSRTAGTARLRQTVSVTPGKTYLISFDLVNTNPQNRGGLYVGSTGPATNDLIPGWLPKQGNNSFIVTAPTSLIYFTFYTENIGFDPIFDNISVRELPGNHATQSNPDARPILARVPETGRRNLATTTELDNTLVWTQDGLSSLTGGQTDPNGGTDAFLLTENTSSSAHRIFFSRQYSLGEVTVQIKAKAVNRRYLNFNLTSFSLSSTIVFDLQTASVSAQNGGNVVSSGALDLGDGWVLCTATVNATNTTAGRTLVIGGNDGAAYDDVYVGSGTDAFYLSGFQLEAASSATAYQKVVDQYDITEAGVTSLEYLAFDGADDCLFPPSGISSGWTAGHAISAQKNDSLSTGAIVAQWGTANATDHEPYASVLYSSFGYSTRGTFGALSTTTEKIVEYEVSGSGLIARIDGTQSGSTHTGGSVAWRAQPNIGKAITTAAFFDGRWFGSIIVNRNLTSQEASDARNYLAAKSGVTL